VKAEEVVYAELRMSDVFFEKRLIDSGVLCLVF
jgi:hypothetical protein